MSAGITFGRHVGWQLAKSIIVMFVLFLLLLVVFDFTQRAQSVGGTLGLQTAAFVSILRGPSLAEDILPFAVLFGSMVTFVQLNRRLELTVARAAGVSAWQILLPAIIVALLLGLFSVLIYNPAAISFRETAVKMTGLESASTDFFDGGSVWLRQGGEAGASIIGASQTAEEGRYLAGVTAFQYTPEGEYSLRVDAPSARLVGDQWIFESPTVMRVGQGRPVEMEEFRIQTNMTIAQIRESLVDPDTVAIWRLPTMIDVAAATSVPADHLRLRFHSLISLPFLLAAMVLIAAVVTLRFSRTLRLGRLIVTGAASGFVLYVVLVVSRDLGRSGIVSPAIAAWAPALIATLVAVSVLLREEDG